MWCFYGVRAGGPIEMNRPVTNWPYLPPSSSVEYSPQFPSPQTEPPFLFHGRFVARRGTRRLIVVWLNFWTGIDGPIQSSHRDSAKVSNPPAGRISPRICTPINGATAPSPVRIGPHPSTTTSIMVLWWGGRGGFGLWHP